MDSILVTGGELPEFEYVKHLFKGKYVCVADSGFDWVLENNIDFNVLVGDMDSVKAYNELSKVDKHKIKIFDKDKDDTDTIIGLKHLSEMGFNEVAIIGGGGGRLDHLLGILSLFKTDLAPSVWYTRNEVVYKTRNHFSLNSHQHKSISVFPLDKVHCSIRSYGLKWKLDDVDWCYRSIGISNYIENNDAWINSGDNELLLILPIIGNEFD